MAYLIEMLSRHAAERNVFQTTFDSEGELFKLKEHYPNVEAVVRIRAEDPDAAEPVIIT